MSPWHNSIVPPLIVVFMASSNRSGAAVCRFPATLRRSLFERFTKPQTGQFFILKRPIHNAILHHAKQPRRTETLPRRTAADCAA